MEPVDPAPGLRGAPVKTHWCMAGPVGPALVSAIVNSGTPVLGLAVSMSKRHHEDEIALHRLVLPVTHI